MTTRSGATYKPSTTMSTQNADGAVAAGTADVSELVRLLLEDRRTREEELTREREIRARAEAAHAKQIKEQLGMIRELMTRSSTGEEERQSRESHALVQDKLVLTRFVEGDDIEAFLTIFERMMTVYRVEETRWAAKLAPQLSGRAQQAYAAMTPDEAMVYAKVKKAILSRYDISPETYRQRFRAAKRNGSEPYIELAPRMADLFRKWTADCDTVEAITEKLLIEQLLSTMPTDLRIWLGEKKPSTCSEAGKLADDYVLARKSLRVEPAKPTENTTKQEPRDFKKCYTCHRPGHWAHNCPGKGIWGTHQGGDPSNTNSYTSSNYPSTSHSPSSYISLHAGDSSKASE